MRNKSWLLVFLSFGLCIKGQEPQFTQFYAAPLFMNPAFTGLTVEHRFTAMYRQQWPNIRHAYKTYLLGYDYNLSELNSGLGGFVMQDVAGTSKLVTNQFGVNYAYRLRLKKNSEMRFGLMLAFTRRNLDYTQLLFNDQLISGAPVSQEARGLEPVNYLDLGGGALYNSPNFWAGVSVKHLNEPNASMAGQTDALPLFVSVHGGYRYIIAAQGNTRTKLEEFIIASIHYRKEQKFDQLDIGAYYFKSFINVGVWYRGLPFKHYKPGYRNRESIAILLGLEVPDKNFRMGYSYDITVSRLGISSTQGSHEVSLVYEIARKRKKNKRVLVSCPKF